MFLISVSHSSATTAQTAAMISCLLAIGATGALFESEDVSLLVFSEKNEHRKLEILQRAIIQISPRKTVPIPSKHTNRLDISLPPSKKINFINYIVIQ